ncbi:Beta-glucan synthesis-associated protein skn1, partial [Globisporangium polare]
YWGGPRCTYQLEETSSNGSVALSSYGPPVYVAAVVAGVALVITLVIIGVYTRKRRAQLAAKIEKEEKIRGLKYLAADEQLTSATSRLMPLEYEEMDATPKELQQ